MVGKKTLSTITKMSPTFSCYILYFLRTGKIPNLKYPRDFNEKMTYLKLYKYASNPLVIQCTDKYLVRDYVKLKGYEHILNEIYGVYDNFDEIDFSKLPVKFALKCNHGCAYNIICNNKSKFDLSKSRRLVGSWLKEKYGLATQELQYSKIQPRIIIENNLSDDSGFVPIDYKLYCFNGKVVYILVATERYAKTKWNFYDTSWNEVIYFKNQNLNSKSPKKPTRLKEMIRIANDLSSDFPFVRVDLYEKDNRIIFGELTFTPSCCCNPDYTNQGLRKLGSLLTIKET